MGDASIQFMITNAMKKTLVEELEFLPDEVEVMRPEVAKELIDKKMKRPFGKRPMPEVSRVPMAILHLISLPSRDLTVLGFLLSRNFHRGTEKFWPKD